MTPRGKRSIPLITALLAVLLALGIPAGASADHSISSSSSDQTSQDHSRYESDDDHDRGYGNDDRDDKDKDKDKDKGNSVGDSTTEPIVDPPIDPDAPVDSEAASDLNEPTVDEPTDATSTDEASVIHASDEGTDPDEAITDDDSVTEGSLEDPDGIASDIVVTDSPADSDDVAASDVETELPTDPSTEPPDTLAVSSIDEVTSVEIVADEALMGSSIEAAVEKPIEVVAETVDLPETAVEADASSDQKPSDTVQAEKSTSKTDRDESASDHDKGYGNDDKESKTKDDKASDTTPDVATPDELPVAEPTDVDTTEDLAPVSAVKPVKSPDVVTDHLPGPAETPATPLGDDLLVLATPVATEPAQLTETVDPGPDVTALLATEQVRIAQSALAATTATSAIPSAGSLLAPLGRMLLPPAGLALVDLLADTGAPVLNRSSSESVTEAAQQAAGLVAIPAAALTALTLLGWAIKPAAIKASAFVAGRIN